MKQIKLELNKKNIFEQYIELIKKDCGEKPIDITFVEHINNMSLYRINYEEECEDIIFSYLAFYLLSKFMDYEFHKSSEYDENKQDIINEILVNVYYPTIISIELKRFFLFNDKLNENVFLKFNFIGFKEELKNVNTCISNRKKNDEIKEELFEKFKEINVDINDLEDLKIEYIGSEISLITKSQDIINKNNIYDKLKIKIETDEEDGWASDIYFCTVVCSLFNTKTVYIKREFIELYEELKENFLISGVSINMILGD